MDVCNIASNGSSASRSCSKSLTYVTPRQRPLLSPFRVALFLLACMATGVTTRAQDTAAPEAAIAKAATPATADDDLIRQIDNSENNRETNLTGYTVQERYTITNGHFDTPGVALVKVTYKLGQGKQYEVVSREGPGLLASKLLDSMLAEEKKLSLSENRKQALVTSANYTMTETGEEQLGKRACEVVAITPREKGPYLMNGRIWVDAKTKLLAKVEGVPTESPSFFAGKPNIVREYGEINGFALANHSHATTSGFFTGKTVVDIDYIDYQVFSHTASR